MHISCVIHSLWTMYTNGTFHFSILFSLLEEYKKAHTDVSSSYVVSGEGPDGNYCIDVCTDDQLEGIAYATDFLDIILTLLPSCAYMYVYT
jgi:hypothetical protein